MLTTKPSESNFRTIGRDSPLKKSASVTAIIHGTEGSSNNKYYVDSLERFKRDHASVDKQERDVQKQKQENNRSRKRNLTIEREGGLRQLEDGNYQKMKDRQSHSQQLHSQGSKLTIHSYGSPIDPVTLRYENTDKGRQLQRQEQEKHVNTLVRAHKLQTWGTSGYNIINGQHSLTVEQMVPKDNFGMFEHKLGEYYQKFRVKPDNL